MKYKLQNTIGPLLIVLGLLGLLASFTLTADKIHVLRNPDYIPVCNINPIFSCGSIMSSSQSEVFGVPNTVFGLMAFSAIVTIGVAVLFKAKLNKTFWQLFQLGAFGGLLGVVYLFYQGTYVIGAICLWCALTWATVIALNLYLLVYNWRVGNIAIPKKLAVANKFLQQNHLGVLLLIYLAIVVILVMQFDYYFLA